METVKVIESPKGTFSCEVNISVEEWKQILSDETLTKQSIKETLMDFYDEPGHKATCKGLSIKHYGNDKSIQKYKNNITNFGKTVINHLNRFQIIGTDEKERFWPVVMNPGQDLSNGLFEWTLRKEVVLAIEALGWNDPYAWIPFYTELADKLLAYKDNRKELVSLAYESGHADYMKAEDGGKVNDIDPFTFFGIFSRGLKNRTEIENFFKEKLLVKSEAPFRFAGIPVVNKLLATFYSRDEISITIPIVWELFEAAIKGDKEKLVSEFDKALKQKCLKWNLTMGLYWIRPYEYIGLDSVNRAYLKKKGINVFGEKELNGENYLKLLEEVKQNIENHTLKESCIPEISYNAWVGEPERDYWLVGYAFGGTDSQLERFVEDGIWEGGFDTGKDVDKATLKLAKSIKQGDVLILKSSSTKGSNHDIPFLRIKTAGIVTSDIETSEKDGHVTCKCSVEYAPVEDKDFDGPVYGSYRKIVHKANDGKINDVIEYADSILDNNNLEDNNIVVNKYQKYIDLLKTNYNLILTGAPGTGKTYMAKEIAKAMGCDEEEEIGFVQFHPSYDYTDFVEGLRPVNDGSGHIGFERRDGVFKEFCKKALQNLVDSQKKSYVFIIDEINRGEASKIFGELFFAIDPGYRGETGKVMTQYQNLIEDGDPFSDRFFVPENVYIIGTMNDIDRSVESMDFAMRRRFTWVEVTPEDTQDDILNCLDEGVATEAKDCMKRLNEKIKGTDGLGEAYQIGAAYFRKLEKGVYDGDFDKLWDMNLKPLLREYLRGFGDIEEKMKEFETAYLGEAVTEKEDKPEE